MSTATQGRAREHKVRDHMADAGWHFIMRAAASKGPADLLLAHPEHGAALVQVGTTSKSLGPADRIRFLTAADLCGALPILATVIPDPGKATTIRYLLVGPGPASTWEAYTP
ncbi:hypothetical protein LRP67_16380 [Nocardioides sp. cx-169]|uniref:hypothetical protein n=1 Tax=Nocardioides sp. cx-169 TaxID=2899080 RepID=UPI001E358812|nr:hypothetical protein [Nocardioides sp. cx-169]MCD4535671.1 hypothetical protein [Nocardioides sp. cx-169]